MVTAMGIRENADTVEMQTLFTMPLWRGMRFYLVRVTWQECGCQQAWWTWAVTERTNATG